MTSSFSDFIQQRYLITLAEMAATKPDLCDKLREAFQAGAKSVLDADNAWTSRLAQQIDAAAEPWCNHDAPGTQPGDVCECGARISPKVVHLRDDAPLPDHDAIITRYRDRYFVTLAGGAPATEPTRGFPDVGVAVYELAAMMVRWGRFPAAWLHGVHGTAIENIDGEVRALHDAGGTSMLPLIGTEYQPGDRVRYADRTWTVRMDYGAIGVWLYIPGTPEDDVFIVHRVVHLRGEAIAVLTPALEPGQPVTYHSYAAGTAGRQPATFVRYGSGDLVVIRQLGRIGSSELPCEAREVRAIPRELMNAARGWAADCQWIEDTEGIEALTDRQILQGVQLHYDGGWARFAQVAS